MMECPNCKKNALKAWKGSVDRLEIALPATGKRCAECGEIVLGQEEMERLDTALATALVARGVANAVEFKLVRKAAGLQTQELATLLDVSPETVWRWENGKTEIPRAAAFALGELYDRPRVTREKLEAFASSAAR